MPVGNTVPAGAVRVIVVALAATVVKPTVYVEWAPATLDDRETEVLAGAVAPAGEALKANTAPNEVTNPVVRTSASFCIIRVRTIEVPLSGPRCMSNGNTDARTTLGSNGKNGQLLDNRMTTQSGVTPFIARCTHVRVRPSEYRSFNRKKGPSL
jgi:hypothetical protein